jgi:hypothetical protein
MADVKTISGVFTEHMLNILYKEPSGLDWGLCLGRIRNRSCYGSSLWEEIMLLLTFLKDKGNAGNKKFFLMLIFLKKPTVLKIT